MLRFSEDRVSLDIDAEPVEFWPYTTVVLNRIIEMPYKQADAVHRLLGELLELFKEAGFDCAPDNKIAFGLKNYDGTTYYIGFYDWKMSVGRSYQTDSWNQNRKQKK